MDAAQMVAWSFVRRLAHAGHETRRSGTTPVKLAGCWNIHKAISPSMKDQW
jgi:hypothetical protein